MTLDVTPSTTYLAPHPWDALGKPPKPGADYAGVTDLNALTDRFLELNADAQLAMEEADEHEEEARECRNRSNKLDEEATAILREIRAMNPQWADALDNGDDPREALP